MSTRPANDLFLRALALEDVERVPLWIMRQAGRYLPEYRATRKKAGSFMQLCRSPEFAAEVTLQPIDRFGFDAAIVFSDILTIPDGFGLGLDFKDGEGPWLERPLRDENAVSTLPDFDVATIGYVGEAISSCHDALAGRVPLIGFAGGPFTLACYMVDGKGGEFHHARTMLRTRPELFSSLLEKNSQAVARSLLMQAKHGADALMIFESWAGLVSTDQAQECLTKPLRRIISELRGSGCGKPVIAFWRNASQHAEAAISCGIDGLGVDWLADMRALSERYGEQVALQGNLDPAVLLSDPESIRAAAQQVLDSHRRSRGHIFNLGHGIIKETPPDNVHALVEAVRELSGN